MVKRFEVYFVRLDPTQGAEMRKTRPCVVLSPDEMNHLQTVLVAPMTTKSRSYPSRVQVTFQRRKGQIALDQIRAVDRSRLIRKAGTLSSKTGNVVLSVLREVFAE